MGHAFDDFVAVLDVLVEVLHPRVEDVTETVLPQVLHRYYSQCLRERTLSPHLPQLQNRVEVRFESTHLPLKLHQTQPQVLDHLPDVVLVAADEIDDRFPVIFGDVLRLTDLAVPLLLRVVSVRLVGRFVLVVTQSLGPVFVDAALLAGRRMTRDHSLAFQSLEVDLRVPAARASGVPFGVFARVGLGRGLDGLLGLEEVVVANEFPGEGVGKLHDLDVVATDLHLIGEWHEAHLPWRVVAFLGLARSAFFPSRFLVESHLNAPIYYEKDKQLDRF